MQKSFVSPIFSGRNKPRQVTLADHYGMCFGVRDALRNTHKFADAGPITILGQLVHNPEVDRHLEAAGVRRGKLESSTASTSQVAITAHGSSDRDRQRWQDAGYKVLDTTCPLVRKAHQALAKLVAAGYFPVVIGKEGHEEVRGLIGDFPGAVVIAGEEDFQKIPHAKKIGVVSQTTQPAERVKSLIEVMKLRFAESDVRYIDTICQPTKARQSALEKLCATNQLIVVVGGRNSNNTAELVRSARNLGVPAQQIETADDIDPSWLTGIERIGVTAGTSTLDETVQAVLARLKVL